MDFLEEFNFFMISGLRLRLETQKIQKHPNPFLEKNPV